MVAVIQFMQKFRYRLLKLMYLFYVSYNVPKSYGVVPEQLLLVLNSEKFWPVKDTL